MTKPSRMPAPRWALAILVLACLLILRQGLIQGTQAAMAGALGLVMCWLAWRRLKPRWHGQALEQAVAAALNPPDGWRVTGGVAVPSLGDADLLIENLDGQRFAVEIKSHSEVALRGWFKRRLVRKNGKAFVKDPLVQAAAVAHRLNAVPVVWFPAAGASRGHVNGVLVVMGPGRQLWRALAKF